MKTKPKFYLPFEQPIFDIENSIGSLEHIAKKEPSKSLDEEILSLKAKKAKIVSGIFSKLQTWQVIQIARHQDRPNVENYIDLMFTDFIELHGDRAFRDDSAIMAGMAKLDGVAVMVIGHRKGDDINSKIKHNFGMPKPEGYRKAKRLMLLAESMKMPIITLIDTPGAYPGIDAEERGQSEAIATNLEVMSRLKTPIISVILGEGGSGGALAIGVCDTMLMLQYSIYSVISPEGCASILWKDAKQADKAADILQLKSSDLLKLKLIDRIVEEPEGSACRDHKKVARSLKGALIEELNILKSKPSSSLVDDRYNKLNTYSAIHYVATDK